MMRCCSGRVTNCRHPFTASQWEELEQQALVFKYMASGAPIPDHLIYTVQSSFQSSISPHLLLHHHQPQLGWSSGHHMARKMDPEPGRCRRTDGKKWRCSKDAYRDSKYCERHMHRGRNRSRKPVEIPSSSSSSDARILSGVTKSFLEPNHFTVSAHKSNYRKMMGEGTEEEITHHVDHEHGFFSTKDEAYSSSSSSPCGFEKAMQNPHGCNRGDMNVWGLKIGREEEEPEKVNVMHNFLDECPPKSPSNWPINNISDPSSCFAITNTDRTHLPNSMHDFFITQN